jgi:hypothetical protein
VLFVPFVVKNLSLSGKKLESDEETTYLFPLVRPLGLANLASQAIKIGLATKIDE